MGSNEESNWWSWERNTYSHQFRFFSTEEKLLQSPWIIFSAVASFVTFIVKESSNEAVKEAVTNASSEVVVASIRGRGGYQQNKTRESHQINTAMVSAYV
jgi:hypothetical protein